MADWYEKQIRARMHCGTVQRGHHIDSLPIEEELAPSAHPVVVADIPAAVKDVQDMKRSWSKGNK